MLIIQNDYVINLDRVMSFKIDSDKMRFYFSYTEGNEITLVFKDEEDAKSAFEAILYSYEYGKKVITL